MRLLVQRCSRAEVRIDGEIVGKIGRGFVVFVGITHEDTRQTVERLAKKVAALRIFEDEAGKMNLALSEVGGAVLSISQFTLYGDAQKGNRPSFVQAAPATTAKPLYDYFNQLLQTTYQLPVATGQFQADMQVDFINDGPVTIMLHS